MADGRKSSEHRKRELSRRGFISTAAGTALLGATARLLSGTAGAATSRTQEFDGLALTPRSAQRGIPTITVLTGPAAGTSSTSILLTPHSLQPATYQSGNLIVSTGGQQIRFDSFSQFTSNLEVQKYKGEPVLTFWRGGLAGNGWGQGVYKLLDSEYNVVKTVQGGKGLRGDLHEFFITPEGTALFTAYSPRSLDLSPYGGPANGVILDSYYQEVDISSGKVLTTWRAADHVSPSESYLPLPSDQTPWDFFHINSIDVANDGNLLISSRHCFCVFKVDRSTGEVIWRLHGKNSDFKMGEGSKFEWQHHARHHPGNELTLFDDGAGGPSPMNEKHSRGLKLKLHYDTMTCELVQAYEPRPKVLAAATGSVQVLPNGNVFVGWGTTPYFSEFTADGQMLYCAQMPANVFSYRALRAEWPPQP